MGVEEAVRLAALREAVAGRLSNREAIRRTGLSRRQWLRLKQRYKEQGAKGLVHGNRGRPSKRRIDEATRARIVELLDQEVVLNDCHMRDLLQDEGIVVSAETIRRIRRSLGRAPKQRRRPDRHRHRREREAQMGSMVQTDGSPFQWLGKEQPPLTLVGMIDDATGGVLSLTFRPHEDLHGYVLALRQLILRYGVPCTLYGDRSSILVRNDSNWTIEEELAGKQAPTHFGAMLKELGVRYIGALSPQAKGRIERLWRTLQDRLAAELAMAGCRTPEQAEAFLPRFIKRFNLRFAHDARESGGAWLARPKNLDRILACRYMRKVTLDNTVTFFGERIAIPPGPGARSYARRSVEVRELLDGRILVLEGTKVVAERAAPAGTFILDTHRGEGERKRRNIVGRATPPKPPKITRAPKSTAHPQGPRHPWKRSFKTIPQRRPGGVEGVP